MRAEIGGRDIRIDVVVAEQIFQEAAGATHGVGVLRTAIVLGQRGEDGAALIIAFGTAKAATAQPLQTCRDLFQVGAHLLNLVVDRTALRRPPVEQREESGTVAAHALRLQRHAIEFTLLLRGGVLVSADLFLLGRIRAASVDARQLRFQPRAHRVDRRSRRALLLGRRVRVHLCPGVDVERADAG